MLKKAFDFFIFTSLFIALCAVVMVYQTALLFRLQPTAALYFFVGGGAICSYNFHWYLTPPVDVTSGTKLAWNLSNKRTHFVLACAGLLLACVASFFLLEFWAPLLLTAGFTFLYSAPKLDHPLARSLKRVAIGKTIYLAFAWMHVTTLLPLLMEGPLLSKEAILFVINRFFFIYAICILFDYRDVEEDRRDGIRSMITLLNEKGIDRLFWFSILVFCGTLIPLYPFLTIAELTALLLPGIILCFLYYPSKKNFSDYLYYFVLDGLMMLSAPLLVLSKFDP